MNRAWELACEEIYLWVCRWRERRVEPLELMTCALTAAVELTAEIIDRESFLIACGAAWDEHQLEEAANAAGIEPEGKTGRAWQN